MPKIIENIRERLLEEAKKQIEENGYAKTTIRSVAVACGLGVGTVYNYFESKDQLIASFMAEDWLSLLEELNKSTSADDKYVLESIFHALTAFIQRYKSLFCDKDAEKVFLTAFSQRHKQLRSQLAAILRPICDQSSITNGEFLSEYVAESLLTWTIAGKSFEEQYEILCKIIR